MSFGTNIQEIYRRAAKYTDKILKGAWSCPFVLGTESPPSAAAGCSS
jgi:hypothetical protein